MKSIKPKRTDPVLFPKPSDETAIIRRLSLVSIIGNTILSAFKMAAGITGHSGAMISDSIHSFSDVFTTLIAWIFVRISKKAPDENHPYGHDRFECAASLILGFILLLTGISIGKAGIQTILSGSYHQLSSPGIIALVAAILSITVKEAMFWYTRHYALLIRSSAFMADAWHHRSDAFSSVGSLLGIGGAICGFPVLDPAASVLICLFIIKAAWDILKDSLVKMLDTSCGKEYEKKLECFIASQKDVLCIDMLRSRMFGSKIYIDLEIGVDAGKSLYEAHEIAERVHSNVEKTFPDIKHIMIHVNPADTGEGACQ